MSWKKGKSREARGKKNILLSITQMSRLKYLPNVLRKIVHRTKTRYCFPFLNGSFHGAFFFQAWNAKLLLLHYSSCLLHNVLNPHMCLLHSLNTLVISSCLEVKVQWKPLSIKPFVPIDTAFEKFDQQITQSNYFTWKLPISLLGSQQDKTASIITCFFRKPKR